eukprot:902223-Pleurochrysis_carterae.AAC.1
MAALEQRSGVHAAWLQTELAENDRRMDVMSRELLTAESRVKELEAAFCDASGQANARVDARIVQTSLALVCKDLADLEASDEDLRAELLAVTNKSLKDELEIVAAKSQNSSLQ